jgi:hypothetical protein
MRLRPPPAGRSRTEHVVIHVILCWGAAGGFAIFFLGDLLGAGSTVQVIAFFVSFVIFLVADLTDLDDTPGPHEREP